MTCLKGWIIMRLDQWLQTNNENFTRTKAQDAIKAGRVSVNNRVVTKPAFAVDTTDTIEVQEIEHDYVSRAGGKLLAAYDAFGIDTHGQVVLDIGASTGGFTQCALEHGACKVYALDVGHLQLSDKLAANPAVVKMEGVNIRDITCRMFDPLPQFVCMDVSFISAATALQALFAQFIPEHLVVLVKPQFECGKQALNKRGVIRHPKYETLAQEKIRAVLAPYYGSIRTIASPVVGRTGNQEYVVYASKRKGEVHD